MAAKVLEMNSTPAALQPSEIALSRAELQAIAEGLISRELPAFDAMRDRLAFEAGAKSGGMNFFRWGGRRNSP